MNLSFQLYSARNFQPWDQVFADLSAYGYRQVEGYGALYEDPSALSALLDANGLSMPSGHFSIEALENDMEGVIGTARTLGMKLVICPNLVPDARPLDAAGWRAFGARLADVSAKIEQAGLRFAWHNHAFEFAALPDGSLPITHILETAPDIGWEIDIAWLKRGGADIADWISRYGERILAAHIKDIAPEGTTEEDGWADVGHGTLPWTDIFSRLRDTTSATLFVLEHDNPADLARFAQRSLAEVSQWQGAKP